MRRIGVGYRRELHDWLIGKPAGVQSLEITAEHFFLLDAAAQQVLNTLSELYPTFVHGLGLSLGTPGPLCQDHLEKFATVADWANAEWVSEHVSFTRSSQVDLGHLNPILYGLDSLEILIEHALEVAERCHRKLILENVTSSIRFESAMSETHFLNQLCERAQCGLLLDVTNLFINSQNHHFDPVKWLYEIAPHNIVQLHVVGYSKIGDTYHDHHAVPVQDELLDLIRAVDHYADIQAVTLERDERLDRIDEIDLDLARLASVEQAQATDDA